jgi:hypothetical protein
MLGSMNEYRPLREGFRLAVPYRPALHDWRSAALAWVRRTALKALRGVETARPSPARTTAPLTTRAVWWRLKGCGQTTQTVRCYAGRVRILLGNLVDTQRKVTVITVDVDGTPRHNVLSINDALLAVLRFTRKHPQGACTIELHERESTPAVLVMDAVPLTRTDPGPARHRSGDTILRAFDSSRPE